MHDLHLLKDLCFIWLSALFSGYICLKLKLPPLAGYMLAGIALGPHGFKLISDAGQINVLAEFGVAMLLFALGVDLSLKQLASKAGKLLATGTLQIVLTALLAGGLALALGLAKHSGTAFLFGCVCALSSSVIISKILYDRGETDSVHGRILLSIAILQDLSLVLIIPFLPLMASEGTTSLNDLLLSAGKAIAFILIVVFGAVRILPVVLAQAARSNSRELFLLTLLGLCLSIALLSHSMGLSIALGAFLAGIMVSESIWAHQALHDVQPLKDLFSVVFFVSVGMLLTPAFIFAHSLEVLLFVVLLVVGKTLVGALAALCTTSNTRSAILVGAGLAQIGEFSFVLLTMGRDLGLVGDDMYNLFFAGAVVSLMASPAIYALSPRLIYLFQNRNQKQPKGQQEEKDATSLASRLKDHVIICGFGRTGRNLGTVLTSYGIPYLVIELNAAIVEDLAMRGVPHIWGDATSNMLMTKANLKDAACLVLTMPDPSAITAITKFVRKRNEDVKIIARAHSPSDIAAFTDAGVSAVVQPEFEASIEITRLALFSRNRPPSEIEAALDKVRAMRYPHPHPDFAKTMKTERILPLYMVLEEEQTGGWLINDSGLLSGKSAKELNIRGNTGVTITAVRSGGKTHTFPSSDFVFNNGDEVYAVGTSDELKRFKTLYKLSEFTPFDSLSAALSEASPT